jgi:hypothetical protein
MKQQYVKTMIHRIEEYSNSSQLLYTLGSYVIDILILLYRRKVYIMLIHTLYLLKSFENKLYRHFVSLIVEKCIWVSFLQSYLV